MKKYLIILQQAPFTNSQSLEGMELSLALAAFAQPVSLLFTGAGVLQLLANKNPSLIAHKDFTKVFTGLELFDIQQMYAEQESLQDYNLVTSELGISPSLVARARLGELIAQHEVVLTI